jgi:hypothetical protein
VTVSELLEKILPISISESEVELVFEATTPDGGSIRFTTKNIQVGNVGDDRSGKIVILGY